MLSLLAGVGTRSWRPLTVLHPSMFNFWFFGSDVHRDATVHRRRFLEKLQFKRHRVGRRRADRQQQVISEIKRQICQRTENQLSSVCKLLYIRGKDVKQEQQNQGINGLFIGEFKQRRFTKRISDVQTSELLFWSFHCFQNVE